MKYYKNIVKRKKYLCQGNKKKYLLFYLSTDYDKV